MITAEGAPVAQADQKASNGVIHVLHKVIWPIPQGTVADLLMHDRQLSTLLKAVQAAKLEDTLRGEPQGQISLCLSQSLSVSVCLSVCLCTELVQHNHIHSIH